MSILNPSAIKQMARAIADGHTCYIHRYSKKITTIDHTLEDPEQIAAQKKEQADLERKIENYVKLEKLNPEEQLVMRKDFLEDLPDRSIRKQLSNALNRKNPIRNFNQAVEGDMELNQHWRNFRMEEYQRWVSNFLIDAYNY